MHVNRLKTGITRTGRSDWPCPIACGFVRAQGSAEITDLLRILAALMLIAGCRQDMQNQPKMISQRGSEMFADHRGARPQVMNTVARGQLAKTATSTPA